MADRINRDRITVTRETPHTWHLMPPAPWPRAGVIIVGWIKRDGEADEAVLWSLYSREYSALQLGGKSLRSIPQGKVRAALAAVGVDPDKPSSAYHPKTSN